MTQITLNVRMDAELKQQVDAICTEFGMTPSTAVNIFARTVVRERRIPFEIAARAILSMEKRIYVAYARRLPN